MGSFKELSKLFVNNFVGGQRQRSSSSLLTIEQGENETYGPSLLTLTKKP